MMDKFVVLPLVGFNDVKFGMSRKVVRDILGLPIREFRKTKYSKTTTDDYGMFHIFYDKNDAFEAVEFFGEVEIRNEDHTVFPKTVRLLSQLPYAFVDEGGSYINEELSIGIYAPDNTVESILFGVTGYY